MPSKVIDLKFGPANSTVASKSPVAAEEDESIGTTANHPFWSVDRKEFIQAGQLQIGEELITFSGEKKRVVSLLPRPGPTAVFNIEVDDQHVYYVGEQGALVHNAYSRRDLAFAAVKSARRHVEKYMSQNPRAQQLLAAGDYMRYGLFFDAKMKKLLGLRKNEKSMIDGLEGTYAVVMPGGRYGVKGEFRLPDLRYRDELGNIVEYWDIKSSGFVWGKQFQDILDWTGIRPIALGYNR